jgi:hypothetical protein
MGLKYVEDPGDGFSFTLKDGGSNVRLRLTHDIYERNGHGFEMRSSATNAPRRRHAAPARRPSSSPMRDRWGERQPAMTAHIWL